MLLIHIARDGIPLVPPFPVKKIPSLIRANAITRADYYWHEGMNEWVSVGARWPEGINFLEDDEPAATPLQAAPSAASGSPTTSTPHKLGRRERASLLRDSQRRYHETLVPWSGHEAAPQAG